MSISVVTSVLLFCATLALLAGATLIVWGSLAQRSQQRLTLRVLRRQDAGDTAILTLGRRSWRRLPAFRPGQYLAVEAAIQQSVPPLMRCYSLARWQRNPYRYQLAIKRAPDGRVSNWLADNVQVGSRLTVRAPSGEFVLQAGQDYIVLIAGGVGITPLLAMLDGLRACRQPPQRVVLLYAARHYEQLLWHKQLLSWEQQLPWFDYRPCLSAPEHDWQGWRGRLDAARLAAVTQGWPHAALYQCASDGLMTAMSLAARQLPLPGGTVIHQEAFGVTAQGSGQWHGVSLGQHHVSVEGGRALLAELESVHHFADASCRAGECGGCRLQLLSGDVEWLRHPVQPPQDGLILACCCSAKSDLALAAL